MSADSKLVVGDSKKYDVRPKKVLCGEDYEDVSWISETQQLFCGFFFPMHWCQSTTQRFTSSSRHSSKCYSPALKAKEPGKKRDNFQSFLMMTLCPGKKKKRVKTGRFKASSPILEIHWLRCCLVDVFWRNWLSNLESRMRFPNQFRQPALS